MSKGFPNKKAASVAVMAEFVRWLRDYKPDLYNSLADEFQSHVDGILLRMVYDKRGE